MIGNRPLSVSILHDCLGHPLISFPFISKHPCPKKVSEIRSVHKSLALHYVRDMFSPFHNDYANKIDLTPILIPRY